MSIFGTSESAPLVSGEAALVIERYRKTHDGDSPGPALVKTIIDSSAVDLGLPAEQQGAGLIDSLRAVRLAAAVDHPTSDHGERLRQQASGALLGRVSSGLIMSPASFSATAVPSTPETFDLRVTNPDSVAHDVTTRLRALAPPFAGDVVDLALDPPNGAHFIDQAGASQAYVPGTFSAPAGADHLTMAIAGGGPFSSTAIRLTLIDPGGRFAGFSTPMTSPPRRPTHRWTWAIRWRASGARSCGPLP